MKFKSGYLGICIVVLSLLLGTAGSLLLNVDKTAEASTKYDYKTDITGLFDTTQEPQYIDFSPATNYNGYAPLYPGQPNPSGIDYVVSPTSNNYRVLAVADDPITGPYGTVNNSTSLTQATFNYSVNTSVGSSERVQSGALTGTLTGQKVASLYTWVTSVWDLSTYSEIEITLSYPAIHAPTERAGFGSALYIPASDPYYSINAGHWDIIKVFSDSLTFQYYTGGTWSPTYSLYDYYMVYGDATQREIYISGGNMVADNYATSLSLSYTSTMTPYPLYEYMVPSQGVTNTGGYVTWDNDTATTDYDNFEVSIIFGPPMSSGSPVPLTDWKTSITLNTTSGGDPSRVITFTHTVTGGVGSMYASYYNYPDMDYPIPSGTFLGDFDYILVVINKIGQPTLTVYPVVNFNSYTDFEVLDNPLISVGLGDDLGLDYIYFYNISGGGRWSVYSTKVFLNTYNSVMVNPSINLTNYWPDMTSYRYAFQSFALYGNSITINGVTYPVTDDNKITIDSKKYTLDNFYLSYSEQDTVSITFKNINRTVELGDISDRTVSFNGVWYFSAGLYEGSYTTTDTYAWDDNLIQNLNPQLVLLLSLGLLLGLSLLFIALFKVNVGTMDKVVLIFAGVVILCILGGL